MSGFAYLEQPAASRINFGLTHGSSQLEQPEPPMDTLHQRVLNADLDNCAIGLFRKNDWTTKKREHLLGCSSVNDLNAVSKHVPIFSINVRDPLSGVSALLDEDWSKATLVDIFQPSRPDAMASISVPDPVDVHLGFVSAAIDAAWARASRVRAVRSSALQLIQDTYVIENRGEVAQFVETNQLASILVHAREPLNNAFGEQSVKTLTVLEDDEGFRTLFCLVMVPGDMQEARRALRYFDTGWWLRHSARFAGKLNFDFELV